MGWDVLPDDGGAGLPEDEDDDDIDPLAEAPRPFQPKRTASDDAGVKSDGLEGLEEELVGATFEGGVQQARSKRRPR